MAETKLFNCLGLCQRAGKCQSGAFAAERALKAGKAKLVLLEENASENTKDRFSALCEGRKVPLRLVPEVGRAIGREAHGVMAVTDIGFVNMILDALASETEVGG
ncbi:MAG: ribosomal L7Ae/L30e/S12e/Gadd45 family protein [Clostridia bacterium]|nr:ribosomal L7Ae/L30e/S12e/Gadd45 family protein [Clostridia bacterium]